MKVVGELDLNAMRTLRAITEAALLSGQRTFGIEYHARYHEFAFMRRVEDDPVSQDIDALGFAATVVAALDYPSDALSVPLPIFDFFNETDGEIRKQAVTFVRSVVDQVLSGLTDADYQEMLDALLNDGVITFERGDLQ